MKNMLVLFSVHNITSIARPHRRSNVRDAIRSWYGTEFANSEKAKLIISFASDGSDIPVSRYISTSNDADVTVVVEVSGCSDNVVLPFDLAAPAVQIGRAISEALCGEMVHVVVRDFTNRGNTRTAYEPFPPEPQPT